MTSTHELVFSMCMLTHVKKYTNSPILNCTAQPNHTACAASKVAQEASGSHLRINFPLPQEKHKSYWGRRESGPVLSKGPDSPPYIPYFSICVPAAQGFLQQHRSQAAIVCFWATATNGQRSVCLYFSPVGLPIFFQKKTLDAVHALEASVIGTNDTGQEKL